jgi:hypothetical protein
MRSIHYSKEYIPNRKEYPRNSKRAWPKHGQEKTRGQQIEEESCPNVLHSAARYPSEQQAQQTKTRKNSDLNTLTHMLPSAIWQPNRAYSLDRQGGGARWEYNGLCEGSQSLRETVKPAEVSKVARGLTVSPLTLMFAIRTLVQFVIHLTSIFTRKAKIVRDLLEGGAVLDHHIKGVDGIDSIFFFEFSLEFISGFYVEFVAPMRDGRGPDVE